MNFDDNFIRNQKIDRRIKDIPKIYRKIYEKAVINGSKPAAIKAFCLECVCWQKNEIINCTSLDCPLYAVRPFIKFSKTPAGVGFSAQT
jgi:hypothetical protein